MDFETHEKYPSLLKMILEPQERKLAGAAMMHFVRVKELTDPTYFDGSVVHDFRDGILQTQFIQGRAIPSGVNLTHVHVLIEALTDYEQEVAEDTTETYLKLLRDLGEAVGLLAFVSDRAGISNLEIEREVADFHVPDDLSGLTG